MEKLFDFTLYVCATTMVISMTLVAATIAGAIVYFLWQLLTK